jgi:hypothetical protein
LELDPTKVTQAFSESGFSRFLPLLTPAACPEGIKQGEQYQYAATYYETTGYARPSF